MRTVPQKFLLVFVLFLSIWVISIAIDNYKKDKYFQGNVNEQKSKNAQFPHMSIAFVDGAIKKFLGQQIPSRIVEMPDMFSPEGTIDFRYVTKQVEGRQVLGKKYLMDIWHQKNKNRLAVYLETIGGSNYLVLEIYTFDQKKYLQKVNIDKWKDNKDYPMAVTWSNKEKTVRLFVEAGPPTILFKTENDIFVTTGVTAYFF